MPHVCSSAEDSPYTARLVLLKLSHAFSAQELVGSGTAHFITKKPPRPMSLDCHIRHNYPALLRGERQNIKPGTPEYMVDSPDSQFSSVTSDCRLSITSSLDLKETGNGGQAYPSPPASETGEPEESSLDAVNNENLDTLPFPLHPASLISSQSASIFNESTSRGRTISHRSPPVGNQLLTPPTSPDRFIPNRTPEDLSKTFRLGKAAETLTRTERLLRHNSASPDPFGSLHVPRIRDSRASVTPNESPLAHRARSRVLGTTNISTSAQDPMTPQNRQISAGAVWNVGGSTSTHHSGPIRGIPNGRGGFTSSGSNAPMYTSHFLDEQAADHDVERMQNRVAAALDIDQTRRVLRMSPLLGQGRSASTGSLGLKRKSAPAEPRTCWKDGKWILEESLPSLRDDYYCTVLAYCHTARTLAVGLGNRVYLWSKDFGVRYPPDDTSRRPSTYVTSVSFSSTEGGHSILATGRNTGQICLWSLDDLEEVRFKSQQPSAIACLAFKPVVTRRQSERFGSIVETEELLVGDEVGNVYYYAVEWMSRHQIDIHGWNGSMKLLAKIAVHSQQICGLAWSLNGDYFATGANDNLCCLFEVKDVLRQPTPTRNRRSFYERPLQSLIGGFGFPSIVGRATAHAEIKDSVGQMYFAQNVSSSGTASFPSGQVQRARIIPGQDGSLLIGEGRQKHKWVHSAAIKAIAFCPWQPGLIATGGGSNDRAIHFYHVHSGVCLATINVHAQVTSLIWSTTRREIAVTFGYAQPEHPYRIAVFSWPECKKLIAIPWASDMRALLAISYPDGPDEVAPTTRLGEAWCSRTAEEGCIVVACSDESVKFHEVWCGASRSTGLHTGLLGGSSILEGLEGIEKDGAEVIR